MRVLSFHTDPNSWWQVLTHASGDLIFDIGANVGQYAHVFSKRFNKVVSFEPCAESYALLYAHHPANVVTIPEAVTDHVGTMQLAESEGSIDSGQLTSRIEDGIGWGELKGWRTVSCTTIDQECLHFGYPDAVKIDTEGCEMDILAGAPNLIERHNTTWYLELHAARFEPMVREIFEGYRIEIVHSDNAVKSIHNYYALVTP